MFLAKPAKLAAAGALTAIALSACGIVQKPFVGVHHVNRKPGSHAVLDNPRVIHRKCLKKIGPKGHHPTLYPYRTRGGYVAIQVGHKPKGPTIVFYPTSSELLKITGKAPGGVMIGASMVFPNQATDKLALAVIKCVDIGVPG